MGGMTPEEFQNYLGLLSRFLRLKATECEAIDVELRSHLEERLAALTAQGIEPARAVSMALAEFGDAAALAAEFTAVSRLYKRRWIMRFSIGSIAASLIAAALIIAYWPAGPVQLALSAVQAQPAEKSPETPVIKPEKLDANAQTQAKLEKLIEVEFVDQPLTQVLDYLDSVTDVQFHMDLRYLTEAGISSDTPITLKLKNVPAEMVLRLMCRDLNLGYWLDNGVVIVSTADEVNNRLETRIYRVDDLVCSPSVAKNIEASDNAAKKQKVDYDSLIELLTTTIKPQSWDSVGGPGSIAPYRGTLVISQTAEVHRDLQKFLNELRLSINKEIDDDYIPQSKPLTGMGGMGGGMGQMKSSDKEEDKETAKSSPDQQQKTHKGGTGEGGGGGGIGAY